MSDIIILGDVHLGCRNASTVVMDFQLKFFEEQLFPFMETHKITKILQSGDLFDTRKYSNHNVLYQWHKRFFQVLEDKGIELHVLIGNHDTAAQNTNEVNSPELFLGRYKNVVIYNDPKMFKHEGLDILIVPWICQDNEESVLKQMSETKAKWCFGHFEVKNYEMHKGQVAHDGLDAKVFDNFDVVLSGHFHTRNTDGKIKYVGTPYEMTWIDYGDPKGFHVLNPKTKKLKFVKNNFTLFNKVYYDDKGGDSDYYKSIDLSALPDSYVKVVVINKTDLYQFDRFMDKIYQIPVVDLKITEDVSDFDIDAVDDEVEVEDTKSLIESYVDVMDTELDKAKLKSMMQRLYTEALEVIQ